MRLHLGLSNNLIVLSLIPIWDCLTFKSMSRAQLETQHRHLRISRAACVWLKGRTDKKHDLQ